VATIGNPISHSLSPLLHQAAFDALGLDWVSVAFPVAVGLAPRALDAVRVLDMAGLSVTMPHKSDAAGACDELTPLARRLGAVNCVTNREGRLVGDSTDGPGLLEALERASGSGPGGLRCVVIGAGGAGRAAVAALADAGAAEVVVVNRTLERAEVAASLAGPIGRVGTPDDIRRAELVVHAIPLGMSGSDDTAGTVGPFTDLFHEGQVVMDLVYEPLQTPLLKGAAEKGAVTVSGLGMLVHQAAISLRSWTGLEAPTKRMWEAAVATVGEDDAVGEGATEATGPSRSNRGLAGRGAAQHSRRSEG
jgi:shikimate dehydrogenase